MKNLFKNLFCLFCYKVRLLVNVILGLFGIGKDCYKNTTQSGEFIVTGSEAIDIPLKDFPKHVKISFTDDPIVVPCNPQNFDILEWEIIKYFSCCKYYYKLHIKWTVTDVREISWIVYF